MVIEPNSIINGDCLEVMKFIPDKSIDCVICDLPYGITACKWDTVIPFEPLWEQYKRIIKPNGAIVLFGSQPFTSAIVMSNPKWFKYEWIWEKGRASGFVHAKNKPMKAHENILIFSKGTTVHATQSINRMNYFPQLEVGKQYKRKHTSVNTGNLNHAMSKSNLNFVGSVNENDGTRYPRSVLSFSMHNVGNIHPTQKPVALIEYLIKTYTQEGELILDNTAGSGTLAIAAINTNRRYICIEKDEHYFEVMRTRIANHDPNAPVKRTSKPKPVPEGQLRLFA